MPFYKLFIGLKTVLNYCKEIYAAKVSIKKSNYCITKQQRKYPFAILTQKY